MRQKSNHLLDFLADRDAVANNPLAALLAASGASIAVQRAASQQPVNDEEDAAGESDDAMGEEDESGQPRKKTGTEDPNGRATPDVNASQRRATSVGSTSGDRRVNGKPNGEASVSSQSLEPLTDTPSRCHFGPISRPTWSSRRLWSARPTP